MPGESPSFSVSSVVGWGSVLAANLTVMVQPWILGGAIPLSRLTLQLGASAAVVLSLLASGLGRRERLHAVPTLLWLVLGLAGIGVIQLLPFFPDPVSQLDHAVSVASEAPMTHAGESALARSFSPGDTRLRIAQLIALGALLLAVVDQVRTRRHLLVSLILHVGNASLLALVALLQMINDGGMIVGAQWIRSTRLPFATFVNPNNAAGWLCVQLAFVSTLFAVARRGNAGADRVPHRHLQRHRSPIRELWNSFLSCFVGLDVSLLSILLAAVLILTAIAATFSRGGIIAAVLTVFVAVSVGMRQRKMVWIVFLPLVAAAAGILALLQMDTTVAGELATLSDPLAAGAVRIQHWLDSLRLLLDFPILGCGLGAYQFATLPYQSVDNTAAWYRNADNQYVELAVESGLAGTVLLALLLTQVLLLLRRIRRDSADAPQPSNRNFTGRVAFQWLLMMLAGQVVSASFDFGIALTATSSLVILGFGCCIAMLQRMRRSGEGVASAGQTHVGTVAAYSVRLGVAAAALSMVPDVLASSQVYAGVLNASRVLRADDLDTLVQTLPDAELVLFHSLRRRSDDSEGLMMASILAETEFRAGVLKTQFPDSTLSGDDFAQAWAKTRTSQLAERLLVMRQAEDPNRTRLERIMMHELGRSQLPAVQLAVLERLPLVPSLRARYASMLSWLAPPVQYRNSAYRALDQQPAASRDLFWLGRLSQLLGEWDDAKTFWTSSLRAGSRMRTAILTRAVDSVDVQEAVRLFGGDDYRQTMLALKKVQHAELRKELLTAADRHWQEGTPGVEGFELWELRDLHLTLTDRTEAALEWATDQMQYDSPRLEIRRRRARLLEASGERVQALREWRFVLSMSPNASDAAAAVLRLQQED